LKLIFHRLIKGAIIFAGIGIILLVTLYLLRSVLIAPHIQRFLENSIESQLGMEVTIGNIGWSYITDFEVANVTTLKPAPAGILVSLELKRLRVSYNLLSILKGLNAFLGDAAVELEAARLEFDLSHEDVNPSTPSEADSVGPIFLPGLLPRIRVDDASVFLRGSDYETAFKGIALETRPRRQMTSIIQLRVSEWSWVHPDLQAGKTPVSAEIEYSPEKIIAKRLMLGGSELAEFVKIELKALPETMPFEAKLFLADGRLALDGKLGPSNLSGRIKAENLDLAQISSFFPFKLALEGKISMKADIILPLEQPTDFVAGLELQLKRGNIYGLAADELNLQAAAKDGKIRLDKLDLRTGGNFIEFRDVSSASQAVFAGDVEGILQTLAGGFSFDCRDVPAFFSLAGVDLSAGIDAVPAHRLMLDGEISSGDIIISGGSLTADSGHIRLEPSRIALPSMSRPIIDTAVQAALDIDFPDLELLGRLFAIPELGGSVGGHITVTGTFGAPSGMANISAKGVSFRDVTYGDLTVKANADSQTAAIESVTLLRGKDRLTGRGRFHFVNQEFEDVQLEFRLSDLASYIEKFWPENWNLARGKPQIGGSLAGKVTISGPLAMPGGTADIKAQQLSFEENQFGNADIRLHSNGQKITVETLKLRQAKDRVDLKGSFDLKSRIFKNVKLDIAIADLADYTKNLLPQKQAINASILANLKISGPLMEPEARADIALKEVQLNDFKIPGAIFKLHSSGRRIHIGLARVNTTFGQAKLVGDLLRGPGDADFDLKITDLTLSGQNALMTLNKPGYVHFSRAGDLALKDISLSGPSGDLRLKGSLSARRNADFDLVVSDFGSHGWFESFVTDRIRFSGLNARIRLSGSMDNPSLTVAGDLAKLDSPKDHISLSGRFDLSYTKSGVLIRQFQWQGRPGQQISVTGTIPVNFFEKPLLRPGPLSVDARISIPDLTAYGWFFPDYIPSDGDLEGKLQMTGTWKSPSGTFIFRSRGLNDPPHLKSMPPGPVDIDGNIRLVGKKLVVESIQINSPKLTFTSHGEWTGMPALTDLFQGKTAKPAGNIDMRGNLGVEDLSWLAADNPSLRRVSGRLEANVTMKGPISDPAVDAVVRLTDGELRPNMDVPSLQALNLNAVVTPAGAKLQMFTGELGGAAFHITGSVMRNSQNGAVADLRLQGENLLFYRSAGLKVRADTDITVKGPVKRLEVGGEVAITDGRLVKYLDFLSTLKGSEKPKIDLGLQLFSIRKPPFSDMVFDVRLTSKNPFSIRNNLAKGAVRPELKLIGTGELPVLSGKVYVDPTRIRLPAGSLLFESGVIRFDPKRPDRPTLDLFGTSKMLGYEITMLVEGPYNEPVVTLSSVPPLTHEELVLLIIAGKLPDTTDDPNASQGQSMNVAVYLGRDFIERWFGSESAEAGESIMDRFEVHLGRAVTRGGEDTIEAQFRIADGVLRDGDRLYLTGEKDIFDFYNAGVKIVFRFK
jgi:autotransporter translocation and assembly factor TamB